MAKVKQLVRLTDEVRGHVAGIGQVSVALIKVWDTMDTQAVAAEREAQEVEAGPFPQGEIARALCVSGRQLLQTPATPKEILIAVQMFNDSSKWPGPEVITDPNAYLEQLLWRLDQRQYPAAVLFRGVQQVTEAYEQDWVAPIGRVLQACDRVKANLWAAIRFLEAPASHQSALAIQVYMRAMTKSEAARELAQEERHRMGKEYMIPKASTAWALARGGGFERREVETLGQPDRQLAAPEAPAKRRQRVPVDYRDGANPEETEAANHERDDC